jgi:hypothetical protein
MQQSLGDGGATFLKTSDFGKTEVLYVVEGLGNCGH